MRLKSVFRSQMRDHGLAETEGRAVDSPTETVEEWRMSLPISRILTLTLLSHFSIALAEQESVLQDRPGHSVHGDSFDEGPRRFATLMGGTGNVHFPVTTKSEEAQKFFDQGVGQLHGFWYYEAERSFRQVLHLDPNCVMAYWGMAMANVENETRAREIIGKAVKEIDKANETEKLWIKSLEKYFSESKNDDERKAKAKQVIRDWEAIAIKDPNDLEAKAFVVYQAWWNSSRRGVEIGSPLSVHTLAQEILAKNPLHPVHHYLIHLWDKEGAKNGIPAAAMCGPSAPSIAHMWHMPGHIYADLERWSDSALAQEAATRVDHKRMMERGTMPDQIHNYAHNSEWMIRNWNHLGRVKEALLVSKNMIEEPRIPRSSKVSKDPNQRWDASGTAYTLGRQRLVETLLRWELWDEVIALAQTPYLDGGMDLEEQTKRDHLLALANFEKGNVDQGKELLKSLEGRLAKLKDERRDAMEKAEAEARDKDKKPEDINKAMSEALATFTAKVTNLGNLIAELNVMQTLASGDKTRAAELRAKLKKVPEDRLVRLDLKLGKNDEAIKTAKDLTDRGKLQVQPLAQWIEALQAAGKMDEAKEAFQKLRTVAGSSDADLPIFKRLQPVIAAAGLENQPWMIKPEMAKDIGDRPDLNTLGPLAWGPIPAPEWNLITSEGKPVSSSEYAGRPHIVIFFLGKGCPHCVQQLRAFEPKAAEFAKAGLPIVTVSTDTMDGVAETIKLGKESGGFPFPILSDAHTMAFRAFNAYDDFESKPLHGTYLIDAQGMIRWQHISYEPFMLPDFLLEEAQRLLKLKGTASPVAKVNP